jgi:NADH-ubiquinone oxidoreductase chain 2
MPKISILILLLEIYSTFYQGSEFYFFDSLSTASNFTSILTLPVYVEVLNYLPIDTIVNNNFYLNIIKNVLLLSSLLSLIIGTVVGLGQIRIKRLLAYSTISHLGFILLALALNTEQSIEAFLFYIIQYTITNLDIFIIIIGLSYLIKIN